MNRKQLTVVLTIAVAALMAIAAASAGALPCEGCGGDPGPGGDPGGGGGGGPTTHVVTAKLTVVAPSQGKIVDTAAPAPSTLGDIDCGTDCTGSYAFSNVCSVEGCEDVNVKNEELTATGVPGGFAPQFIACTADAQGACIDSDFVCGPTCGLFMDTSYRVRLEYLDVAAPGKPTITAPAGGKVGPNAHGFSATASDNVGVASVHFLLDGVEKGTDSAAPYQFDAPVNALSEGDHQLAARAVDAAGNQSALSDQITFHVDKHAGAAITAPAAGGHFQTPPQVTFSRDGDVVDATCQTLKASLVVSESACSTSFTPDLDGNGDGDYVARVIVTDDVGNTGRAERGFKIDTGDPNVTITSPAAGQHVKSPFTPAITATDGGTTNANELVKQCKLETAAAFGACGPRSVADGAHTLSVRVRDKAHNERTESVAFVADSSAPQATITAGPPDKSIVTTATVSYAWSASDASAPVAQTCSLDGAAAGPCSSPKTFAGLNEGNHTFVLRVADRLGNAREIRREVFVNAVRPQVAITSGPTEGEVVKASSATFGFSVSGGAVSCSLDSETAFRPCSSGNSDSIGNLPDGAHTFRVRVVDESDDAVVASRTFSVDTSKPREILNPTLTTRFRAFRKFTTLTTLVLKQVPSGSAVDATCKGRRCPVKSFHKTGGGTVKLRKLVNKRLRAGTTLTIRVTKGDAIGKQFVLRIRSSKAPKLTISALT